MVKKFKNQDKILKLLQQISHRDLDYLSQDDFHFKNASKESVRVFMDCVWLNLGKTTATEKEIAIGMNNVYKLAILACLAQNKLIKLTRAGYIERTKLGESIAKIIK